MDLARSHAAAWKLGRVHFDYDGDAPKPRGFLIGEAPGPNTDAKLPLFPVPNSSAAGRLLRYADIHPSYYLGRLARMNLCDDEWSERRAVAGRVRAISYLLDATNFYEGKPLRVLLLGGRVAKTWAFSGSFGYEELDLVGVVLRIAWIPHPSGRCHLYNERKNQLRARRAVQWAVGERDRP